jgi:SagB-type dehydrogenase family enzyme
MYPSGGSLYPTRIYIDAISVKDLNSGLYLFNPFNETLNLINNQITDKQRLSLRNNSITIDELDKTSFQILITIKPQITVTKYGEHGIKLALIEIGHLAQNIILVATACGLKNYPNSSISLKETKKFLRSDPQGEFLIYSLIFS